MRLFLLLLSWLTLFSLHAAELRETPAFKEPFAAQHVRGTLVLYDLAHDTFLVHDATRAAQRFTPASTFKIANTLIGVETGAVKSVEEILPYGGKPQLFKEWEHDMSLREAMRLSAVPIYQELARRIGPPQMAEKLKAFGYGNAQIGTVIDQFWLEGPLAISAIEQVEFLARLVQGKLPVSAASLHAVEDITLREHSERWELHYKTGWVSNATEHIGWLVGWVITDGQTTTFALNMEMADIQDAPKRLLMTKECLSALGLLP